MKRTLRPDELVLWSKVAATIRPAAGRSPLVPSPATPAQAAGLARSSPVAVAPPHAPTKPTPKPPISRPNPIEPGRMRRLTREREPVGPRLDLHGLNQDEARERLTRFLRRAYEDDWRAVMVITGKGSRGDGVLRRYAPEWLAAPGLRDVVAGVAEAHRRHGGEGALYVALKRRSRD